MKGGRHTTLALWLTTRLMLVATGITTSALALLVVYYQPRIVAESQAELRAKVAAHVSRSENILALLQAELELLGGTIDALTGKLPEKLLHKVVESTGFSAVYQIDRQGKVMRAAVQPAPGWKLAGELLGSDLSGDRLREQVLQKRSTVWSGKYLSPVSQRIAVAIGIWSDGSVLIGEIPLDYLLSTITDGAGENQAIATWVTDAFGDILADSEASERVGVVSLSMQPFFASKGEPSRLASIDFEGHGYDIAVAHSDLLNWWFIVRSTNGLQSPRLRAALEMQVITLGLALFAFLLLTPFIARRIARPIAETSQRALEVAQGKPMATWAGSQTKELNELASSLETMATAQEERRQEIEALFDASPVGVAVVDPSADYRITRANNALCELLGHPINNVIGKTGLQLNLWTDLNARRAIYEQVTNAGQGGVETVLRHRSGREMQVIISARSVHINKHCVHLWALHDVSDIRRIETEVRLLNEQLEDRVSQRTGELQQANQALSTTISHLNLTRTELVRAEKLASLGSLVAGVAHELNTPIGNGVIAVSTVRGALQNFRDSSAHGLKRSALDTLIETVETGTDIAERNMARAAELITSFKQVAADQSSSQRRHFSLHEVVSEIALTLRPSLRHSKAALVLQVPEGITLDSYPGPLGQVLTNLINNAILHAFATQPDGRVTISAQVCSPQEVCVTVADNGMGIDPEILPRIFDPFVTSKMGRGGTGLGLNIAHNLTVQVLGGDINVINTPGKGAAFVLNLPLHAPLPKPSGP
jgi:PAS domain S-box-containing protein